MACAIQLKDLSKTFISQDKKSFQAVNSLNVTIGKGTIFGFVGPNGAGKTTTLKMICGLITPTKGSIHLYGYDALVDRNNAMRQVGVVLEGTRTLYWQLNVFDNLLYFGRLKGCFGAELFARAELLLHELELWDKRYEQVGDFSRGAQQKVAIACALIANPPIILFDEPTLGLDLHAARMVKSWIKKLAHEEGKTIVLTTHQLDIAENLCDQVGFMNNGLLLIHQPYNLEKVFVQLMNQHL